MLPKRKLRPDQIAAVEKWVKDGAVWPGGTGGPAATGGNPGGGITEEQKRFWAFQTVREPAVAGPRHPIDALKIWNGGLGIWGGVAAGARRACCPRRASRGQQARRARGTLPARGRACVLAAGEGVAADGIVVEVSCRKRH